MDGRATVDLGGRLGWMQEIRDERALVAPIDEGTRERACEHLHAADERKILLRPEEDSHGQVAWRAAIRWRRADHTLRGSGRS